MANHVGENSLIVDKIPQDWNLIPASELQPDNIMPGGLVVGVQGLKGFNAVEENIVGFLSPYRRYPLEAIRDERIASDRITPKLRPGGPNSRLLYGCVALVPLDVGFAIANPPAGVPQTKMLTGDDAKRFGIGAVYMGVFSACQSSEAIGYGVGTMYYRAREPKTDMVKKNQVYRALGQRIHMEQGQVESAILEQDADVRGRMLAQAVVRRALSVEPSLGKRH